MILPTCHPFAADLLLFHQPYGDYASGRRAMEEDVRAGKERSIGLSNSPARKMGGRSWGGGRNQAGCAAGSRTFCQLSLGDFCRNVRELASAVVDERPFRRRTLAAIGGYGVTAYGRVEGAHPSRGAGRCLEALASGCGGLSFVARRGCGSCCAWLRKAHSLVANDPSARHRFPSNGLWAMSPCAIIVYIHEIEKGGWLWTTFSTM